MKKQIEKLRNALLEEADELVNEGHGHDSCRLENIAEALDMTMDELMEGRE